VRRESRSARAHHTSCARAHAACLLAKNHAACLLAKNHAACLLARNHSRTSHAAFASRPQVLAEASGVSTAGFPLPLLKPLGGPPPSTSTPAAEPAHDVLSESRAEAADPVARLLAGEVRCAQGWGRL
jgi:hypothetical protein